MQNIVQEVMNYFGDSWLTKDGIASMCVIQA